MEVSGIPPYLAAQVPPEPGNEAGHGQNTVQTSGTAPAREAEGRDRVDLVRAQNLVSPFPEDVDLQKAAVLLRQVTRQFQTMERQDVHRLYQFDRLRDLCCRLNTGADI